MSRRRRDFYVQGRRLYTALGHVLVRSPLLAIDRYLTLGSHAPKDDPSICTALAVGSNDFFDAFERSGPERREDPTVQGKLLRYLTRMSSRATPYGMFAGVQLAQWGPQTDIALVSDRPSTRTRPDMEWLYSFIFALESRAEVRQHLQFVANRTILVQSGRVILHSRAPTADIRAPDTTASIRATRAVIKALDTARTPVAYGPLFDELLALPSTTPAKVEKLITELWEQTFLLTDLRPPMSIQNPAEYVAKRLKGIPCALREHRLLTELLDAMSSWDETPLERAPGAYKRLLDLAAAAPTVRSCKHCVQVDMSQRLQGNQISAAVAADAATAAELLLRLTPSPQGSLHIAAYRQSFEQRYGAACEVPLLELLDSDTGLGSPYQQLSGDIRRDFESDMQRQRKLREVAIDSLRLQLRCVQLDDAMLEALQTWSPDRGNAPVSLDIPVFVAASTPEAIDAGEFRVIVGPNVGPVCAGQYLGRFADMLGRPATAALRNIADAEQAHEPHALSAELTYLPHSLRSANVTVRPLMRDHEIACGTVPAAVQQAIPLDELMVGVREGRFRIRWSRKKADVLVFTSHMLNSFRAPTICRFLSDVRQDCIAQLSPFHWGAVSDFPYLPRVERGRVVLSVAQWRLERRLAGDTAGAFHRALDKWRVDWQVPRYVYLAAGDNRLLVDLDDCGQVAQLRDETRRVQQNSHIVLQEALPGPQDAWLAGPGGRYATELVVSVALSHPADLKRRDKQQDSNPPWRLRPVVSRHDQLRPAGSDWLFVKLYCPLAGQDEFLVGPMTAFCEGMRSSGLVQNWFFIRYKDPESHIRLRFHGDPDTLTTSVLPQFCSWSRRLVDDGTLSRTCVDTYEREMTRYGGPSAIEAAETLFAADSRAAIDLLGRCRRADNAIDRTILSMLNIDSLLAAFGLDERRRIAWYKEHVTSKSESGDNYRERKRELRNHLRDPPDTLVGVFSTRTAAVDPVRARLEALTANGDLEQPLDRLLSSFVHMSCNRLSGPQWPSEQRSLGLLLRTRTALLHVSE